MTTPLDEFERKLDLLKANLDSLTAPVDKYVKAVLDSRVTPEVPDPEPEEPEEPEIPPVDPEPEVPVEPEPEPETPPVVVSPVPTLQNIPMGVNGHEASSVYTLATIDERFKLLAESGLKIYRTDLRNPDRLDIWDKVVATAKKYGITLRPMMYPTTEEKAYAFAKRYAQDMDIWEIGNEQDHSVEGAQERINALVTTFKGVKRAAKDTGIDLKTTINVMSCNYLDTSKNARCANDKRGSMWFLEMAKASGFDFDYVSFHYYPYFGDKGFWMDMYLSQMRGFATQYNTKIIYNEINAAEIYQGSTDGGFKGDKKAYDSLDQILTILNTDYKDIVKEINIYELLDEPTIPNVGEPERHFGLMYDLKRPKPSFELVKSFAK